MHLLKGQPRGFDGGEEAVDLGQTPGDIVILSAADTEIAGLAGARAALGDDFPSVRLANWLALKHPYSVDLYAGAVLKHARLSVLRLLGGASYWRYGLDEAKRIAHGAGAKLIVLSGDANWDAALAGEGTVDEAAARRMFSYFVEGGSANFRDALRFGAHLIGRAAEPPAAEALPTFGTYAASVEADPSWPTVAIVFYRALVQAGQTEPVDALCRALAERRLAPLPLFVSSLKTRGDASFVEALFRERNPALVLNATAFALSQPGGPSADTILDGGRRPVLQVMFAGGSEEVWAENMRGLSPADLSMNVVLPEIDGRLITRAVSFKEAGGLDALTECRPVRYRPKPDRVAFVADLAARWVRLGRASAGRKRVAVVLSNYPNRDGRIANGVGLDAPESTLRLIRALADAGYDVAGAPESAALLMDRLLAGPTNAVDRSERAGGERLEEGNYLRFFNALPQDVRRKVEERWGSPSTDPHWRDGGFVLALHRFGNVVVGVQPTRGYNIDPKATYHDPDLVPPHAYFAFYAWLREFFGADALIHMGKHGNLEWLPGKALALSQSCFPEAALGPLPVIYPFIVNDPGEGAQAKRRTAAIVVDHLMPAMARAESHGVAVELEALIDEFAAADLADPRRAKMLAARIRDKAEGHGFAADLGLDFRRDPDIALARLDAHVCDLKELQIRDGLHVFGGGPEGRPRAETLVALARVPRSGGREIDASLIRALAADLGLDGFDPLGASFAEPWDGPRPEPLASLGPDVWRTQGDSVERLEALALRLVEGAPCPPDWSATRAVLAWTHDEVAPALDSSGARETASVLAALDGRFVAPGPSGAPTRGRPDCLPTGRNFYSVDVRAAPTPAAWDLGRRSADLLAERYFQDEGEWPKAIALTAWGTSNMRTGGDDIAQALALIGARPVWEPASGRVTGIQPIPLSELKRPRVDVTLRISGFFRDAFPSQIALFHEAVQAVAERDEPEDANPIAARIRCDTARLRESGVNAAAANKAASFRVFGSKPGAYGAGLQALIDEGIWATRGDLASAFLEWSAYAYGGGAEGQGARDLLETRLTATDAVVHNQDNREHDILDSDDYYQFEGGLAASVETLRGAAPRVYHNDHSRPERPLVRPLEEEVARVVRGRAANPKWIAGVLRHGYKGAFEMAATVDYLFAFAATTHAVKSHHFELLYDAYLGDDAVRDFIAENNAPALAEMAARFREAIERGLWAPRRNSTYDELSMIPKGGHRFSDKDHAQANR